MQINTHPASFRDPSGFIFEQGGVLYRQINQVYREDYDWLLKSGLYDALGHQGLIVSHCEIDDICPVSNTGYKIIKPEPINFISYPYEWCFSQIQDAALLTLDLQCIALDHDMTLKDASAYNIQFKQGRPVMIDTLSFERYSEGQPWAAYKQFCQHFLAPLALMAKKDIRLNALLRKNIDGIPLDLASKLLPPLTWLKPGLAINLHIHAKAQKAYSSSDPANNSKKNNPLKISKTGLLGIVDGLRKTVKNLSWHIGGTEWGDYYSATNYSDLAFQKKKHLLKKHLETIRPVTVWDLGANTGIFSRIASDMDIPTISFDIDPAAVEINYHQVCREQEKYILPLLLDLTNPSPALGWNNNERDSLTQRGPAGCIIALALIHHLTISNNVPLAKIASFLSSHCKHLIIEFIPKDDSQVQRLLSSRADIFNEYDRAHFESVFSNFFKLLQIDDIPDSKRTLYLMETTC